MVTNFTAVAATINNIGPGLSLVGPAANFNFFSPISKYVLMFDMLAGRLELFPLLILFHPTIWRELFAHKAQERRAAANAEKSESKDDTTKAPQRGAFALCISISYKPAVCLM